MSSDATNPRANSQFEPLSFDANAAPGAATCGKCGTALRGSYHLIGEMIACAKCRYAAQSAAESGGESSVGRAAAYGIAAAIAAGVVNYAISKATGSDVPVFVILAAFAAGQAVRIGSRHAGGRTFQVLAIAMAYLAMGCAYVPLVISAGRQAQQEARTHAVASAQATVDSINTANAGTNDADPDVAAALAAAQQRLNKAKSFSVSTSQATEGLLIAALGAPILISILNPLYGFFIALALYRAWRRNGGPGATSAPVSVSGPFRLQQQGGPAAG